MQDKRYYTLKLLIQGGHIKMFRDIFDHIPKTVVATDLGMNYLRITKVIDNVDRFIMKDLFKLAELIEVEEIVILQLVYNQYVSEKAAKAKGRKK